MKRRHLFIVEFSAPVAPASLARFTETLDAGLAALNEDYRAHRAVMATPEIEPVPTGFFTDWMKARAESEADGQIINNIVSQLLTPTAFSSVK